MLTDDGKHLYVSWDEYHLLTERLALKVHHSGWEFDQILCLARGGMRPGDVLSRVFDKPLAIMSTSSYRADAGTVQGKLDIAPGFGSFHVAGFFTENGVFGRFSFGFRALGENQGFGKLQVTGMCHHISLLQVSYGSVLAGECDKNTTVLRPFGESRSCDPLVMEPGAICGPRGRS